MDISVKFTSGKNVKKQSLKGFLSLTAHVISWFILSFKPSTILINQRDGLECFIIPESFVKNPRNPTRLSLRGMRGCLLSGWKMVLKNEGEYFREDSRTRFTFH